MVSIMCLRIHMLLICLCFFAILCSGLPSYCGACGACPTTAVRMSVIANYLKSRMEILILNAKTGMDTNSQQYEGLSKDAANAIKQVCLGVKGVPEKRSSQSCGKPSQMHH